LAKATQGKFAGGFGPSFCVGDVRVKHVINFYEPLLGEIRVDGRPLEAPGKGWLRKNVTLAQQSSIVFDNTFFWNIALDQLATADVARAACDMSLLQSTIRTLSFKMSTKIDPTGHRLSGGQTQIPALARARLRDPPILMLDEVTSGLDQESKLLVLETTRAWPRRKTTIIITHDVNRIKNDDYVYVMDHGRVVQEGTRDIVSRNPDGRRPSLEVIQAVGHTLQIAMQNKHIRRRWNPCLFDSDMDEEVDSCKAENRRTADGQPGCDIKSPWTLIQTVWPKLAYENRIRLIMGLIFCSIAAGFTPVFSFCFAQLLALFWAAGYQLSAGQEWVVCLAMVTILSGFSVFLGRYLMEHVGQAWANTLRLEVTISITWALSISRKLTLVTLSSFPVIITTSTALSIVGTKWKEVYNQGAIEMASVMHETFINIRVIRAFTLEKNKMSANSLRQVANLLLFCVGQAAAFMGMRPQISASQAAATQVFFLTALSGPNSLPKGGSRRLTSLFPITMRNVVFARPSQTTRLILRGINLDIDNGKCMAIVGPSGCSKSTVISLFMKIYQPHQLDPACGTRSGQLTYEDSYLFPATVADNIAYGLAQASSLRHSSNVRRAAREAGIHDLVMSFLKVMTRSSEAAAKVSLEASYSGFALPGHWPDDRGS
ncbi:abc transporter, partial [Colletotrichum incanum]